MPKAVALVLSETDNVVVALEEIAPGTPVTIQAGEIVRALDPIPFAHKLARRRIEAGSPVLKYGVPIAFATRPIESGEWVHEHNAKSYFAARREAREA